MIKKYFSRIVIITLFVSTVMVTACKTPTDGSFLSVTQSQCIGCTKCYDVCETSAITIVNGKAVIDPASCTECGKCVTICPVDAIY